MKKRILTTTAVLMLFAMLLTVSAPAFAKTKTQTGSLQTMIVASGSGEEVASFKGGKMDWQDAVDVPTQYIAEFGWSSSVQIEGATWITYDYQVNAPSDNSWYIYAKTFDIPGEVVSASIVITADNAYALHVNGRLVGTDGNLYQPTADMGPLNWQTPETYDLTKPLKAGSNEIVVYVRNYGFVDATWQRNPTGLIFSISITYVG